MRLTSNTHEQIIQLFDPYWRGRIEGVNARIRGEAAITSRGGAALTGQGGVDLTASFDDIMSARNPNHIRGLDTTNRQDWRREIDLPEGVREALITFARDDFSRGFGMGDWEGGERLTMLQHSFLRDIPEQDRLAANHTMWNIVRNESLRLQNAARQAIPNWIPGQRVPDEILTPILNHGAGSINITA